MALFQTQHLWVQQVAEGVATLVLDGPDKANYLGPVVLADLDQALTMLEGESRFELCVLRSNKGSSFCHGVDQATWSSLASPEAWHDFTALGQKLCERLSRSRLPTVAMIGGACLGGGLELALACDWRVALGRPNTVLGFTELDLGLVPGWGGIGRLLHLVGLERGLKMLLGGRKLPAGEALSWGLVDDVADDDSEAPPAFLYPPRKRDRRRKRSWRQQLLESTGWGRRLVLRGAERVLRRRLPDDMPAPWETLALIRTELERGTPAGLAAARTAQQTLGAGPACQNLLRLHRLREQRRAAGAMQRPKNIAILGATPLALHLAAQAAVKGCQVVLREQDEMTLGMAVLGLVKSLQDEVRRGVMSQTQFTSNVNRIRPTITWKNFDDVELVIDATRDAIEAEQRMARELEPQIPAGAVIVNADATRALAGLQARLRHPERLVGLHFPAPVGRVPLVEILTGPNTSEHAVQQVGAFAAALGKTVVTVREATGGLVHRVLGAAFAESLHLLQEGVTAERIEQAMQKFGMAYGPLEHRDWLGIDEFALVARRLEPVLGESPAEDAIVLHLLTQRWLGVKTGIGFYRHRGDSKAENRALTRWLRRSFAEKVAPRSVREQKKLVEDRIVGRMVNEAFRCLGDGVVTREEELDLALSLVGWAPHRGGPCRYAEQTGFAVVVGLLEDLAKEHGDRFAPCAALRGKSEPRP